MQQGAYGASLTRLAKVRSGGEDALAARPGAADRGLGRGPGGRARAVGQGAAAARGAGGARGAGAARRRGRSTGCRSATARSRRRRRRAGQRLLHEVELWEVSLVTFPMLPEARVEADPTMRRRSWRGRWPRASARRGRSWRRALRQDRPGVLRLQVERCPAFARFRRRSQSEASSRPTTCCSGTATRSPSPAPRPARRATGGPSSPWCPTC